MNATHQGQHAAVRNHAPWRWALWGAVAGLLLAIVVFAPAQWLAVGTNWLSQGRLQLRAAQGTVWHGTAQLVLAGGAGSHDRAVLPGRVGWRVVPGWGHVGLELSATCCTDEPLQLLVQPGLNGWTLRVLPGVVRWPAAMLAGLGTPWNTVQAQGALTVRTPGFEVQSSLQHYRLEGRLTVLADQISSRLSTLRPLGSYQLDVEGGDLTRLDLRTLQGSLQVHGQGEWGGAGLHFIGEASADDAHQDALSNLLNIIGRREGARSILTLG